jgi:hypothetical protein
MKLRCHQSLWLLPTAALGACMLPPGGFDPAYGRGWGPDQSAGGQAHYAGQYPPQAGGLAPTANPAGYAPPGYYGAAQPQPGAPNAFQGQPAVAQVQAPWPSTPAQTLPGFGPGIDAEAQAEQRAQVFGAMPDVRLGSSRAVEPGSTGVSTGVGGAQAQALQGDRAVPFRSDGGATQAAPQGSLQAMDAPTRQLPEAVQSRSLLIDDYSKALDERDALRGENQALIEQIRSLEVQLLAAQKGLGAGEGQAREMQERADSLQYQLERSEQERADLEARLVTAQIRRLEAEKSLLEAWIEAEQWRARAAAIEASPSAPTAGNSVTAAPATSSAQETAPKSNPGAPQAGSGTP